MIRLSFLIGCLVFWGSTQIQMPSMTDWRGLSPVKSTRMDVERTLGPPDETIGDELITYRFPDVVVNFAFVSNPKCREKLPYTSWDVTSNIVTGINVSLRQPPLVEESGIDLTKFKKVKGNFDLIDHYYYVNDDDSFAIEVGNKYVGGYHYGPGNKQKDLLCEPINKR
jgi:hypothetical protein